ncbi:MerR family transcriptional regulator [Teredinibacter turnerae]|uniref:MerR family transcriptional regulator n=1 Tax=Teredinibacter turnerae TaxID=2426 RepID=UPI000428391A|nr:MerR family DNA-binding protein [Teredinibacter turnerae]
MRVTELAKKLNISPDTVRFYTRKGGLRPVKDAANGYKSYTPKDEQRLRFILGARGLGFTVNDIEEILQVSDNHHTPCPLVRELIEQRLQETEARFNEMKRLRDRMRQAVSEWQQLPDADPKGHRVCHLIETFTEHDNVTQGNTHDAEPG